MLLFATCAVALTYGAVIALAEFDLQECREIAAGGNGLRVADMAFSEKLAGLASLGLAGQLGAGVVMMSLLPFLAATWFSNVAAARAVFGAVGLLCLVAVLFLVTRPVEIWHGCDETGARTLVFALVLVPVTSTLFFACLAVTAFFKTPHDAPNA
ncbi:MAG: hypothetical protein HKN63_04140 [Rhodobacteraceae bacterium]|nr:hypothetical protein [Paracoccaceae bacterium]